MRVIKLAPLKSFWQRFPDAEQPLRAWFADAEKSTWANHNVIKEHYANASIIGNNRVVFNVGGNKYRLVVAVSYQAGIILIKFVGTHQEYDQIDAETVEL